jgi:Tfp pilus assembly protein PilV
MSTRLKGQAQVKGQSLFEVMFALVLVTLVIVAVVGLATVSVRNNLYAKNNTLAKRYAQEVMEWLRKKRDAGPWAVFWNYAGSGSENVYCLPTLDSNFTPGSWSLGAGVSSCADDEYINNTVYLRELRLLQEGTNDKVKATVTVTWTDSKGQHSVPIVSEFTKWE